MEVLKKSVRNFLKNFPGLRLTVRKIYSRVKSINYNRVAKKTTINPKLIMFEVFMGRQYACNPKAIYEYMISDSRFDDYRLVWAFRDPKKAETIPALHRAEIVKMKSKEYFRTCCEAAYIITNSNLDNRITKKAGQKFIQTWHGTPLKKTQM